MISQEKKLTEEEQLEVEKNKGLLISVLNRHFSKFLTNSTIRDDIIQSGEIGLINAVITYRNTNIRNKYKFSTIATRHICNCVMEYLKIMEYVKESHNAQKYHLRSQYCILGISSESSNGEDYRTPGEIHESLIEDTSIKNYDDINDDIDNKTLLDEIRKYIGEEDYNFLINYYNVSSNKRDIKRVSRKTDWPSYYSNLKYKKRLVEKIKKKFPKYINNI